MRRIKVLSKQLLKVAACFLIIFNVLCVDVFAIENGSCGNGVNWSLENGTLVISGNGAMDNYSTVNAPWYDIRESIVNIVVEKGVSTIGEFAFSSCSNLKSITLSNSVSTIKKGAFQDCVNLKTIQLGSGIKTIEDYSFKNCNALIGITFPNGITTIGNEAFFNCESLVSISIPSSVVNLGISSFAYCSNLLQVSVNANIEQIPAWTFYRCDLLTSIYLNQSIEDIGENSFYDCGNLATVSSGADGAIVAVLTVKINEQAQSTSFSSVNSSDNSNLETTYKPENNDSSIIQSDAVENENVIISGNVSSNTEEGIDATIDAVVKDKDGWKDITEKVDEYLDKKGSYNDDTNIDVNISVGNDMKVDGSILEDLAGKNVNLNILGNMDVSIDCSKLDKGKNYSNFKLEYTLEKIDNPTKADQKVLNDSEGYYLKFKDSLDFNVTVKIHLGTSYARNYATLYQKNSGNWQQMQSVKIDSEGYANFYLSSFDSFTKYLIGINVDGVSNENAMIPDDLYLEHGGLMDAYGNRYVITGRASDWGITAGQLTLILIGVIVAIVSIVGGVMYMMHKRKLANERIRKEVMSEKRINKKD